MFFCFVLFAGFVAFSGKVQAQSALGVWEGSAYAGMSTYQGDMLEPNFSLKNSEFSLGFGVRNFLSPQVALNARFW